MTDTVNYYQENAKEYVEQTLMVDMNPARNRFLAHVPDHGRILDAGCGSGRDARVFLDAGYQVTAFDASTEMAKLAEMYLELPVDVLKFQEVHWTNEFDGIWACASLLHVQPEELPSVMQRLRRAMKPGGILYASFKYGTGVVLKEGRKFTNMNESELDHILDKSEGFGLLESWVSEDRRAERASEYWLNVLLRAEE